MEYTLLDADDEDDQVSALSNVPSKGPGVRTKHIRKKRRKHDEEEEEEAENFEKA